MYRKHLKGGRISLSSNDQKHRKYKWSDFHGLDINVKTGITESLVMEPSTGCATEYCSERYLPTMWML